MTEHSNRPEILDDDVLSRIVGGAEYLAPGVYIEEISFRTVPFPPQQSWEAIQR